MKWIFPIYFLATILMIVGLSVSRANMNAGDIALGSATKTISFDSLCSTKSIRAGKWKSIYFTLNDGVYKCERK